MVVYDECFIGDFVFLVGKKVFLVVVILCLEMMYG